MTVTVTVTVTRTITLTQSDSPTATETPTITETHTITETGTITETHTVSPTFTWTPTITWTATVTLTHTETPDFTQTCTITPFYSATPTPTRGPVTAGVNESILYPNPARDRINLSYYMKEAGRVKIRIYNEAGGLAALQEENRPAGNGISFIETEKMAVGVYFCFISLNYSSGMSDKFGVKKFLLIR
jgi:hypothetical protein